MCVKWCVPLRLQWERGCCERACRLRARVPVCLQLKWEQGCLSESVDWEQECHCVPSESKMPLHLLWERERGWCEHKCWLRARVPLRLQWERERGCCELWARALIESESVIAPPVRARLHMFRVGQNHIYTVYMRYFWQGNHQIYGYIRCIYTVLANPTHVHMCLQENTYKIRRCRPCN